jgi:LysM repeat protein
MVKNSLQTIATIQKPGQKIGEPNSDCMKSNLLFVLLLLSGCAGQYTMSRGVQANALLDDLIMEVSDLKHHLNNYHVEQGIAEEKLKNQEIAISSLKKQLANQIRTQDELLLLGKEISNLKSSQEKTLADLRRLSDHSNALSLTLTSYREKMEDCLDKIQRLSELNKTLHSISKAMQDTPTKPNYYTVRPGDSLGKIAEAHHTTVAAIKAGNHLQNDTIFVGQQLRVTP